MREFAAHCKAASSPCSWGSATKHTQLYGKQLMEATGIPNAININYKGTAPLLTDVIGGQLAMRDLLKSPVHQRRQRFERFGVATSPGLQQPGYLGTIRLHSS